MVNKKYGRKYFLVSNRRFHSDNNWVIPNPKIKKGINASACSILD
jgi:hypothetical protein